MMFLKVSAFAQLSEVDKCRFLVFLASQGYMFYLDQVEDNGKELIKKMVFYKVSDIECEKIDSYNKVSELFKVHSETLTLEELRAISELQLVLL